MSALRYILEFPWVAPLGWTLVHFLWQGALIGLGVRVGLRLAQRAAPNVRHLIACGGMVACAAAVALTFAALARPFETWTPRPRVLTNAPETWPVGTDSSAARVQGKEGGSRNAMAGGGEGRLQASPAIAPAPVVSERAQTWAVAVAVGNEAVRWAVPFWLAGVILLGLRLCGAWGRAQIWRFQSAPLLEGAVADVFELLIRRLRIGQRVRLLRCDAAPSPLTLGWIKPVILLPAWVMTGLVPEEIEAILAHELAHIRRHDYLVNLIQSALEIVLFYHPVVWWISGQIREAREECCDEIAAQACADPLLVARALSALAGLRLPPRPALAAKGGSLLARVARLLGRGRPEPALTSRNAAWTLTLACAILATMGIFHSASLRAEGASEPALIKAAPRGLVVDEKGAPVAQARVLLYHAVSYWGLGNQIVEEVRSDAEGRFAFTKTMPFLVPEGTVDTDHYTLCATHEGKAVGWAHIIGSGPERREFTLTLTRPASQNYEVVDKDGKPIAGATLWLRYAGSQEDKQAAFRQILELPEDIGIGRAVTDANGKATLADLPDTPRTVAASKPGYEDCMACTTPRDGTPRFVLQPAASLEGHVYDPLGAPVAGAKVWLYPRFKWHQFFLARTDEHGFYRVEKIWSNGSAPDWGSYDAGIEHPLLAAEKREVAFTSGQKISGFDFTTTPGTEIVGSLLDPETRQPVAGAGMRVDSKCGRQSISTNWRGEFRCRVIPGEVNVIFIDPPAGTYVVGFRNSFTSTHAFGAEFPVTVLAPSGLGKLGTVHGRAIDAEGRPVSAARINVAIPGDFLQRSGWRGNAWASFSNAGDGSFEVERIPIGLRFSLCIESQDGKLAGLASGEMKEERTDLSAPVALRPTTSAEVLVTGLDQKPRRNLAVQIAALVEGQSLRSKDFKTDGEGVLKIPNAMSGVPYRITQADSQYASAVTELASVGPPKAAGALERRSVTIADQYLVRLEGTSGAVLPIEGFKSFFVWILSEGKRVQWANGPLKIMGRQGAEVIVPRKTLVLGKPGDKIDFLIQTEGGGIVKAEGIMPDSGGLIVARAKEAVPMSDTSPDPSIAEAPADGFAGRVVNSAGQPLSGAIITFSGAHWSKTTREQPIFTADAEGVFRIPGVATKWYLYATVMQDGFAPAFLTDIPLGKGFKVTLQNSTRLRGTIGGEQVGKVSLLFERNKRTEREAMRYEVRDIQFRTQTDAHGGYDFPMAPGHYRFTATSEDGRFARGEVDVPEGKATELPIALQRGYDLAMELVDWQTGRPVPGIEICIMEQIQDGAFDIRGGSTRTSDEHGAARWENLMPGNTIFQASRMSYGSPEREQHSYVRWWRGDAPTPWSRAGSTNKGPTLRDGVDWIQIDVTAGLQPIRVLMEKGTKISGVVTGPNGAPMKGVSVGVTPSDGRGGTLTGDMRFTARTDERGEFSGYIPAGNGVIYHLCAYGWPPSKESAAATAISEPFASQPGEDLKFQLRMAKGGWIAGRVLDSAGRGAPGMKVSSSASDGLDLSYADRIATTDKTGAYRIGPLRPGAYAIKVGTGEGAPVREIEGMTPARAEVGDGEEKSVAPLVLPVKMAEAK
jgi:protocatechuate 3,4-dioxygenase beta subunit